MRNPRVCAQCQLEYRYTGEVVTVLETFLDPPVPYQLWSADLHKCPDCGHEIVVGFAQVPFAEHWQDDFADKLALAKASDRRIVVVHESVARRREAA